MFNKKNQIVVAVDKKKLDNPNQIADTVNVANTNDVEPVIENSVETFAESVQAEQAFNDTAFAYGVIKSDHRKYEVVRVKIDPTTLQSVAEKIGKAHDSENRAYMEMQSAMATDMVMRKKEEARITKLKQKEMAAQNNG